MSCVYRTEIIDYNNKQKTTKLMTKYITRYEKARILGVRAKQISLGSPINVPIDKNTNEPYLIAVKELNEQKLNMIIRRYYPDGSFEDWDVNELTSIYDL